PSATSSVPAGGRFADPERCADLAHRYADAWAHQNHCSAEIECAAEKRAGAFYGLDGCARFGPRGARATDPDEAADAWMAAGCARAYEACTGEPRAQCRAGVCIELPPSSIPADWIRTEVPGLVSFFRPSSLVPKVVHPIDSVMRTYEGPRMSLVLDY